MHSVICTSIEMSTTGHSVMNPRVVRTYREASVSAVLCYFFDLGTVTTERLVHCSEGQLHHH